MGGTEERGVIIHVIRHVQRGNHWLKPDGDGFMFCYCWFIYFFLELERSAPSKVVFSEPQKKTTGPTGPLCG